jgi:hypothetical protein
LSAQGGRANLTARSSGRRIAMASPPQLDHAPRWLARSRAAEGEARVTTVGWLLDTPSAGFIWSPPRRVVRERPEHRHAKSLTQCPAVVDADARLFEILCPVDVQLGFRFDEQQRPVLVNLAGDQSAIRSKHLNQMVAIVGRREWAHPDRPVIQLITPYVFIADEPVFLSQLPPYNHYRRDPLPGLMVPGRLPIDIWPRQLMWAFEWHEPDKPLVLRRGEPWWYARFETTDPARPVRLVEALMTPELREHMQGLSGVTNYVGQTYSLLATARARRPARLLVEKLRARAGGQADGS